MKRRTLYEKARQNPGGLRFQEACQLAKQFGFVLKRVRGSHHIYERPGIPEILNFQNVKGKAKAYQVRQLLELIDRYGLQMEED